MSNNNPLPYERRMQNRHRAKTRVQIRAAGKSAKMCRVTNLSASGVAIETDGMQLKTGTLCELAFAIDFGKVIKIHRRYGTVRHVRGGVTGFYMEPFGAKKEEFTV